MEDNKEYYAFISYKREDKKEAKQLQYALEYYRLPNHLRQDNPELPEYVRPVFRDMTDLEVGELSAQIQSALEQSHFLVVVCSPRAANSKWVNDEVEYFISLGKQDKIIPYIIEGIPHANNPREECYPPALLNLSREKELLGANINEVGKDSATIRVVSRMFNIRFDTLYQRYQREQKKRHKQFTAAIVLAFLFLSGIAGWIWYQNSRLRIANSRAAANAAIQLVEEGDAYRARKVALAAYDISPTDEAEQALRYASQHNSTVLKGHLGEITSIVFSFDGKLIVTTSEDKTIRKWDIKTGEQVGDPLTGFTDWYGYSTAYSPDGRYIASVSYDSQVWIWSAGTGELVCGPLDGRGSYLYGGYPQIAISPDSKRIASTSGDIRIWDIETGEQIGTPFGGYSSWFFSINFSPDGNRLVSTSSDGPIRVWDVETGRHITSLVGHSSYARSANYSTDGKRIVTTSDDNTIRIWDADNGLQVGKPLHAHSFVRYATFSPDGKYVVSSGDSIQVWDVQSSKQIFHSLSGRCCYVTFDSIGKTIRMASTNNHSVLFEEMELDNCINKPIIETEYGFFSINISPDGERVVSASYDGSIIVIDAKTGRLVCSPIKNDGLEIFDANFSPDGSRIVSASHDGSIRIWDAETGKQIGMPIWGHSEGVSSARFSPDGKRIVSTAYLGDNTIRIWNAETGEQIKDGLVGHTDGVSAATYSHNGKYILSASRDKTIRIWDAETGKQIGSPLTGHTSYVYSAEFSPDDTRIVSASHDNTIRIWDVKTGRQLVSFMVDYVNAANHASFRLDGKYVVSTCWDGTIRVWNPKTGKQVCKPIVDKDGVYEAVFSPDGRYIYSTSGLAIRVWDFPPLQNIMCDTRMRFKNNPLTPEERSRYYLEK